MSSPLERNVRSRPLFAALGTSLIMLCLLPAGAAMAVDGKVYSPHGCMPAYPWDAPDLRSRGAALENSSTSRTVIVRCPATKDIVSGRKIKLMRVTYKSPDAGGFFCGFSTVSPNQPRAYYTYVSGFRTSALRTLTARDLTAFSGGTVYMYCHMPPGSSLHSYQIDEE